MFSLNLSSALLVLGFALICAQHDHDLDHDHTHAPTIVGDCPDFPPIASLDISKLNGDWFATHCSKNGFDEEGHDHTVKCVKETILSKSDQELETDFVMNRDGHEIKEKWVAKLLPGKVAQFSTDKVPKEDHGKKITYTVMDWDENKGYMICAVCVHDGEKHGYGLKVFSRKKTSSAEVVEKANDFIKKFNIKEPLETVEQNC